MDPDKRQPPQYVLAVLGPAPAEETARGHWEAACSLIDAYRLRWGIDDEANPLGGMTTSFAQAADRHATTTQLRSHQRALRAHYKEHVFSQHDVRSPSADNPPACLPLKPLLRTLGIEAQKGWIAEAALALGVSRSTVYRYDREGLDPWTADSLAASAGSHPRLVWGDDWEQAAVAAEREESSRRAPGAADGRDL